MTVHSRVPFNPPGIHKFPAPVHQALRVKADEYVFVAGQVAFDENGGLVGKGDPVAQIRHAFSNVEKVLKDAGGTFSNVVDFTTFMVGRENMPHFFAVRNELFSTYFPNGDYPPNTLILVSGLVLEDMIVEIQVTAAL